MAKYIVFLSAFLICAQSYAAAWTQNKGSGQLIVGSSIYQSSRYYDSSSDLKSSGTDFTKLEFNPFIEYGLTDDVTVGINPSLQIWRFDKNNANEPIFDFRQCGVYSYSPSYQINAHIFESELFLRKKLYDKDNLVFSVQPLVKTPCIYYNNGKLEAISDTTDYEIRLLGGYGFKWDPGINLSDAKRPFAGQYHFINFEAAYRKRNNNKFSDQIRIDATAGFRPYKELLLLTQAFTTISTGDEAVRGVITNNGLATQEDDYYSVKLQISAVQQITKSKSIAFGYFRELAGRNSGIGNGFNISVWHGF